MPLRRGNQRETASQKASDYSDAIIEFMDHCGYYLDARAEDSGEFEDIVFLPKAGNRPPVVAEAKYRSSDNGFSPNDYVEGFAKRFYQWKGGAYKDHDFYLFTTNLSNVALWRDLFERLKSDSIESFFEKMEEASPDIPRDFLDQHDPSLFERFLENTVVYGDYGIEDLRRINERISETGEYSFDPYLQNYAPIPESGLLDTNLIEMRQLPSTLYKIPAHKDLTSKRFYQHGPHDVLPIHYHEDSLYSLVPPDGLDDVTIDMCVPDSATSLPFDEYACENPTETDVGISKVLIKGVITMIADHLGAVVNRDRGDTRIYERHNESDVNISGKWMTRELDTGEVRHRSVSVFMRYFDGRYFTGFYPTIEFTRDGEQLVSSSRKNSLMESHNPGKYPQNNRKSTTVELWVTKLSLNQSLSVSDLPSNIQGVIVERVGGLELENVRPPKSADERAQLIEAVAGVESENWEESIDEYL